MEFKTTTLQHELFNVPSIADTGQWNFTNEFPLPTCEYDGVKDSPYIIERQFIVGTKISEYLDVPFVWPDRVFFDDLNAWGETVMNGKKSIKYSYTVKNDYWLQTIVPGHEMIHLHAKGLNRLFQMYSIYVILEDQEVYFIPIPTGRILGEGGIEVLLTKIKEPRGGYKTCFQLMYGIDESAIPVKDLDYEARVYGTDGVWHKLYSTEAIKLIDNYVLGELKESGFKRPTILTRFDFSIGYK